MSPRAALKKRRAAVAAKRRIALKRARNAFVAEAITFLKKLAYFDNIRRDERTANAAVRAMSDRARRILDTLPPAR